MVIDREPISFDVIAVRDVDDGHKFEEATICIYRIAQHFKNVKCFAPHCSLDDVRSFNRGVLDPRTQDLFGPQHTEKLYFAKVMSVTDQEVELNRHTL